MLFWQIRNLYEVAGGKPVAGSTTFTLHNTYIQNKNAKITKTPKNPMQIFWNMFVHGLRNAYAEFLHRTPIFTMLGQKSGLWERRLASIQELPKNKWPIRKLEVRSYIKTKYLHPIWKKPYLHHGSRSISIESPL